MSYWLSRKSIWFWLIVLLGYGLRMIKLGDIPPRWDEGWSVAQAALGLPELLRISAEDVHPPLYYMALGAWQSLFGVNVFGGRYLSVLMSLPSMPLVYVIAMTWLRHQKGNFANRRSSAYLAMACMAWLPLGVYYSGVIRMYALAPTLFLLALYGTIKLCCDGDRDNNSFRQRFLWVIMIVTGAFGAMLTLYHAVWGLGAIAVYFFAIKPLIHNRAHNNLNKTQAAMQTYGTKYALGAYVLAGLLNVPWAMYAIPKLLGRAAAEATRSTSQQYDLVYFAQQGLLGLTFSDQLGWWGIGVLCVALVIGLARGGTAPKGLYALIIAFTLLGTSVAARNWTFNARMVIVALPALALLLGEALAQMPRWLRAVTVIALIAVYYTTFTTVVFDKTLEVFDKYNPKQYYARIASKAQPDDVVVFNVLSPAGFYSFDRKSNSPIWSYALTWDPVIEKSQFWQDRLNTLSQTHHRLWLVLYRGLAGQNGDLRGWMDSNFYPAAGDWGEEEVYIGLYGRYDEARLKPGVSVGTRWGDDISGVVQLDRVMLGDNVKKGAVIPVVLTWQPLSSLKHQHKIFIHAVASDGRVVAQHDAMPLNDLRPFSSLPPNTSALDRHGLALPNDFRGELRIVMGLYSAINGQRIAHNVGGDVVELGRVWVDD